MVRKAVSSTVTRPANTTQYAAGDGVSTVTSNAHCTFTVNNQPYSAGVIDSAQVVFSNNAATSADLELFLFHTDVTAVADNAAWVPTDAEMLTCIGVIDFATASVKTAHAGAAAAGNAYIQVNGLDLAYVAGTGVIYGQLVMRNTYTPVASETMAVTLVVRED